MALTEHDAFEARVRTAVLDAVRTSLRRLGALSYYASHYVNGSPEELGDVEAPGPSGGRRDAQAQGGCYGRACSRNSAWM